MSELRDGILCGHRRGGRASRGRKRERSGIAYENIRRQNIQEFEVHRINRTHGKLLAHFRRVSQVTSSRSE